jgi:hypothetical protein
MVVMIAAILICSNASGCSGNRTRYQIAAGAIPFVLGFIVVLLEGVGIYRIDGVAKLVFAIFLILWWIAGFTVLTYFGTFTTPTFQFASYANGFFFSWVALIASCLTFAEAMKERSVMGDTPNPALAKSGFLFLLIIGSGIEIGAAIAWYYSTNSSQLSIYALSLGSVSIFLALVLFIASSVTSNNYELHDSIYNGGMYLLTIWWAVGTLVLTFKGFWNQALDNGYFSLYFNLGACLLALSGIWKYGDEEPDA